MDQGQERRENKTADSHSGAEFDDDQVTIQRRGTYVDLQTQS